MRYLISPWTLARRGILGINQRNRQYIARYNPRSLFPLVDNKLKTRETLADAGIPMANLIGVVETQSQVARAADLVAHTSGFAIKPAKGSGGKGILVVTQRDGDEFIKASGARVSRADLTRHVANIQSGLYSLAGAADVALIEDLIRPTSHFDGFTVEGVPDIRVIVCRGYPVMAMVRLSTHASDGKANLHQGAVGVGLNMATGKAISAVQHGRSLTHHPDSGKCLADLEIPDWQRLLELAAQCYDVTGLGYLGIDIVIDRDRGPLLLELNARPGLAIQLANDTGLLPRLRQLDALTGAALRRSAEVRTRYSQEWFA
ncbi:MAG: alpha-L-glutamate ligase-like protein [Pseudomonadota bacterium]|jgi:alpha-L-glutamate ligase-like protein|nr:alpha-L-glutamate ligase-like protein [Pseudomonadota bacterium]